MEIPLYSIWRRRRGYNKGLEFCVDEVEDSHVVLRNMKTDRKSRLLKNTFIYDFVKVGQYAH